jgi:2-amino-4-hydroxy-6-hydroxymethyldihydropteridine diphosphokinase
MTVIASIGIGSNIGDPPANVRESFRLLAAVGVVVASSSLYLTRAWGVVDQPDFCNAAARIETALSARELLSGLQSIESKMGRQKTYRWGPRLIDLDILTFGGMTVSEPGLVIPHPHMLERLFVLVPLAEIDEHYAPFRDVLLTALPAGEPLPLRIE